MNKFIHKKLLNNTIFWGIMNVVLLYPVLVRAESIGGEIQQPSGSLTNPIGANTFSQLIEGIAGAAAKIGIPVAAIFIIYSGLLFVTARGNEAKLKDAKDTFMYAMIGTAILLGAWVIATAIQSTIVSIGG